MNLKIIANCFPSIMLVGGLLTIQTKPFTGWVLIIVAIILQVMWLMFKR